MIKKPVTCILVGSGFMGREHISSADGLDNIDYIAVVDTNILRAEELADKFNKKAYVNFSQAIKENNPDAVDICVPTSYHLEVINEAAEAGVNILCEKPLALNLEDALQIKNIVEQSGVKIMIAQVLRFWPEYTYITQINKTKTYGNIFAVECKRLSPKPGWNSWMLQKGLGDGAAVDLQIHDMDFIFQLLGLPISIEATGKTENGSINAVRNILHYNSNMLVNSEASYLMPESYQFRMFFRIDFEEAVIEMDFWREKGRRLKVFPVNAQAFYPVLATCNAYREEIDYFADRLIEDDAFKKVPLDESICSLKMCLASQESALTHKKIYVN